MEKSSKPKTKQVSPVAPLKKAKPTKPPLTENGLIQIQAKHEATDKTFVLLHERFPTAFRTENLKPLMIRLNELYSHFKPEFSKSLLKRAFKKYLHQEDYQRSILEGEFFYNLSDLAWV